MHWKGGMAQGFALFTHGEAARMAISSIHNLVFDDGAVRTIPQTSICPAKPHIHAALHSFADQASVTDIPVHQWNLVSHAGSSSLHHQCCFHEMLTSADRILMLRSAHLSERELTAPCRCPTPKPDEQDMYVPGAAV